MTHRHDQERAVMTTETQLYLGDQRQHGAATMRTDRAFRFACGARRVHEGPGIFRRNSRIRRTIACSPDKILVAAQFAMAAIATENNDISGGDRKDGPDLLDRIQ